MKEVEENGIKGRFMALDDLTFGYNKPSVIDLKIGTKTWEEDAPKESKADSKKRREKPIPAKNLKRQKVEKKDTGFFVDLSGVWDKQALYYNYIREKYCRIHHSVMFTPKSIRHRTTHTTQPPTTRMTNGVLMKGRSRVQPSSCRLHI